MPATKALPVRRVQCCATVFPFRDVVGEHPHWMTIGASVAALDRLASPTRSVHHSFAPSPMFRREKFRIRHFRQRASDGSAD
jgi:hypothetical protein